MYPRTDVELNTRLPDAAEFWTPEPDDISEEGFGYFRDVWPIIGVPEDEAREMVYRDRAASSFASELASTEDEFDAIAKVIETGEPDYAEDLGAAKRAALGPYIAETEDDDVPLDGLDVGVAGLVYALSAAGAYPAASCRGHHQGNSWSDLPVVMVAIDQCRAELLAPLVGETGCGFEIDPARPELLVVCSTSIEGTIALAEAVIRKLPEFRACDENLRLQIQPYSRACSTKKHNSRGYGASLMPPCPGYYWCWKNWILFAGKRPWLAFNDSYRILSFWASRYNPRRNELPFPWYGQAKSSSYARVVVLMS